jgi:hypothetical protein
MPVVIAQRKTRQRYTELSFARWNLRPESDTLASACQEGVAREAKIASAARHLAQLGRNQARLSASNLNLPDQIRIENIAVAKPVWSSSPVRPESDRPFRPSSMWQKSRQWRLYIGPESGNFRYSAVQMMVHGLCWIFAS